jgi:putative N6-adenine-specific DNA methylase
MQNSTNTFVAKTSFGFEQLLAEELISLGAKNIKTGHRAVHFDGDQETMYRANLFSRLSLRILKPLATFPAANEQQLYDGVKNIRWDKYLSADDTIAVDGVTVKSNLTHSLYIALKTKDAIVDQFREKTGKRPNVDLDFPTVRINIHLSSDIANVSLDSSGESLHKRGYRQETGDAPLNETLAAGMVMLTGWDGKSPLIDFMCGSGTILIEAAMIARNIAPGIFRKEFGFERWRDFDAGLWKQLVEEAKNNELEKLPFRITGVDRSLQVIRMAKSNASEAGLSNDIDFIGMPFEDYTPSETAQTIVVNPPYGGRITDEDLFSLYTNIGDQLKKKYSGSNAWILTANRDAAKHIGLHPSRKIPLFNGALECRFLKYEMYRGTKKLKPSAVSES